MNKFGNLIISYILEIFLALCMFANLYPDLPIWMYVALLILFFLIALRLCNSSTGLRGVYALLFMGVIVLSTIINMTITYRLLMILIILTSTQLISSKRFYRFKIKFLRVSLIGFAITPILNYYAHLNNINYQLLTEKWQGQEFTLDFAGFTIHPMWLSAACGIATIFFVFVLIELWNKKNFIGILLVLFFIYTSIMVSVWGGSRSALAISTAASMLLIYLGFKKVSKMFGVVVVLAVFLSIALPYFVEGSEKMVAKMEYQEKVGHTSREESWNARIEEFRTSPLYGIGFSSVHLKDGSIHVGTFETGSGWLTILSQTGLLGIIFAILLWTRGFISIRYLRENREMALYFAILVYLTIHTMFEAYIFQAGYYLCFYFWLVLSVLGDYHNYNKVSINNTTIHNTSS